VFEDEVHSGAMLVRPALEALRDLAAQGCIDVVLCYSPDRLARKFAYQALLIEELARCGTRVEFVNGQTPIPPPGTRSSNARRCWWRRCSAATPTTEPPSPTWPAG
jgi:DNA invertase Pin-like site-specific DNA recombinase